MFFAVKDVSINYGELEAVKNVSFEVPQGMIVSLLGANGAGKSTLFKAISGINRLVSGSIWLRTNVSTDSQQTKSCIEV